jgi:3-methylcrotonyl-CoA carboxylase alpha subunit
MFLDSKFEKKMWRIWGEGQSDLGILLNEMALQIKVINSGDTFTFNWEQNSYITSDIKIRDTNVSFSIGANTYDYHFEFQNEWVRVFDNGSIYDFGLLESGFDKNREEIKEGRIIAPITGKVVKILTKKGQLVSSGTSLVIIEAMKMEYELKATKDGKIKDMKIKPNQIINKGDLLLEIS